MKTINFIFTLLASISLMFVTSCSTMQNLPYDDVYYSSTNNNQGLVSGQQTTRVGNSQANNQEAAYQQGDVMAVDANTPVVQDTVYANSDTLYNEDYYDNSYATNGGNYNSSFSLGFGSSSFGSSPWGWQFGGFNSFNPYYGYGYSPFFYNSFYSGYPYYGWGGFNDFYYGWGGYSGFYPGYSWFGNPYGYNNYYNPYYYSNFRNFNNRRSYQVRGNRMGGSNISRSVVSGSSASFSTNHSKNSRVVTTGVNTGKRVPVNPESRNGGNLKSTYQGRPVGSMRFQNELNKKKIGTSTGQTPALGTNGSGVRSNSNTYRRPSGVRTSGSNIPVNRVSRPDNTQNRYQKPSGNRQEKSLPTPRYQKPLQYQSPDSYKSRSSKVYYRTNVRRPVIVNNPGSVNRNSRPTTVRKQNVYRPSRNTSVRSVYRPANSQPVRVKVYSRPSGGGNSSTSRSYSAPSRSYSSPSRSSSSSSSSSVRSSGSSSVSRSSGSGGGGIKRR